MRFEAKTEDPRVIWVRRLTEGWVLVSELVHPQMISQETHNLSTSKITSRGARPEVPGNGTELTSAETCTLVHRDTAPKPIWGLLANDLVLTKDIGKSIGYRYPKPPSLVCFGGCLGSGVGSLISTESLVEFEPDGRSGPIESQDPELQRTVRREPGPGRYLPRILFSFVLTSCCGI